MAISVLIDNINKTNDKKQHVIGVFLGPLFFLIYINDLTTLSDKMLTIMFADDTSIFIKGNTIHKMEITINLEITRLSMWLTINKLFLKHKKLAQ